MDRHISSLKILFLVQEPEQPSTRFAVLQFIEGLKKRGMICNVRYSPKFYQIKILNFWGGRRINNILINWSRLFFFRIKDAICARKFDIVFLQRDLHHGIRSHFLERIVRFFTKKLIFYFDDPIWLTCQTERANFISKIRQIISFSDEVIVCNDYLASFAKRYNKNTYLIPMSIDTSKYIPKSKSISKKVIFGWTGAFWNYVYFKDLVPVFRYFQNDKNVEFRIISGKSLPDFLQGLDIVYIKWAQDNEIEELQKMDVGLLPLKDDLWTRGKFSIKLIQYLSVGCPVICSDVGVNATVIQNGKTGYIVNSIGEWIEKIKLLSENKLLREILSVNARNSALVNYSHETNLREYINIFSNMSKS